MFEKERSSLEQSIRHFCKQEGLPEYQPQWNWIPFSGHWGISTSLFALAAADARQKGLKINVPQYAGELAEKLCAFLGLPAGFEKVEAVKGYLNLYFSQSEYAHQVIDHVINQGSDFGRAEPKNAQIMVEYSQPNTHKAFHVGHLRSAIFGDTLSRILAFAGHDVIRANYPGDMGLHVIKWLWCYLNFHNGEKPSQDITEWMGALYAEANDRLEANPDLEAEVRALYKRWDERDPEVVRLWEETREWSLQGFYQMYDLLDIHFDRYYFNSQMEQPGKQIVQDLIDQKIAIDERPQGAVIVKIDEILGLDKEKYRVFVALRSDGTALYATEDLALARRKFEDYPNMSLSLYVVDVRQSLHFQQVFKTMEIAGYPWADKCQHVAYELVNLPGNVTMSSREGTVVLLEDLIREAIQRAYQVVQQKNPELPEQKKMETARAVGIGALKYPMLARESTKIVTFDWESALDFNGQAAPYIQYAYVRTGSILRKAGLLLSPNSSQQMRGEHDFLAVRRGGLEEGLDTSFGDLGAVSRDDELRAMSDQLSSQETELIDVISRFPREVEKSAAEFRPIQIANYAYELAKKFNDFYAKCPVLQVEEPLRKTRLRLVMATRQTIENSLALLGITAPEAM